MPETEEPHLPVLPVPYTASDIHHRYPRNGSCQTVLSSTLGNLLSGLSDENEAFYLAVKAVDPLVIFALLVITAADENRRFAHGFDALNSGIGIGALGIVVIIHTTLGGHELNSVLHCVKTADHSKDVSMGTCMPSAMAMAAITFPHCTILPDSYLYEYPSARALRRLRS